MKATTCISGCKGPAFPTVFGRRSFIQVGVLSGLGLSLADFFKCNAQASVVRPLNGPFSRHEDQAKSAIQIILPGGLAHQESWDPKTRIEAEQFSFRHTDHTVVDIASVNGKVQFSSELQV